jgi:hypothetical protein
MAEMNAASCTVISVLAGCVSDLSVITDTLATKEMCMARDTDQSDTDVHSVPLLHV